MDGEGLRREERLTERGAGAVGVASFDEFEGGVRDIPDGAGQTPVDYFVDFACIEADGGGVFSGAGVYLQEITFLQFDVVECEESTFGVIGKTCGHVFHNVCQDIIVQGGDVFGGF
jgi:hypothetical protein